MIVATVLLGLLALATAGVLALRRATARRQAEAIVASRLDTLRLEGLDRTPIRTDWVETLIAASPRSIRLAVARADLRVGPGGASLYLAAVAAIALLGLQLLGPIGVLAAFVAGGALPVLLLYQLANYRMAAFVEALPHYLDAIRQLLVVGNSFQQALVRATETAGGPVERYLASATRRVQNGAPVAEALAAAAERVEVAELHMLVTAVRTNMRFGGAIGPILSDLAAILRERKRVSRELKNATGETRISATIIAALPVVAVAIVAVLDFEYISFLWTQPEGVRFVVIALILQGAGLLVMRRVMRLDF